MLRVFINLLLHIKNIKTLNIVCSPIRRRDDDRNNRDRLVVYESADNLTNLQPYYNV